MTWLNCGVMTQTVWPKEKKEVVYGEHTFVLMPPTEEHSPSIHIELKAMTYVEGGTLINRFLSALCWKDNHPVIKYYGVSGTSVPTQVIRKRVPYSCSPLEKFPCKIKEIKDDKAKLAVALYREAISLDSVPFQFLSYFKILNVFWNDKYANGKNELVEKLRGVLSYMTENDCIQRIQEIKTEEGDPADYLYKSGRCAIAHAFAEPVVDPDEVSDLHRLSKDLWLMRNISIYLIKKNFNISQSLWE